MWALAGKRKTAYNTHCSWQGQKGCGMRPSTRKYTQQLDGFQVVREDLIVERCTVEDLSRLARLSCHRRRMSRIVVHVERTQFRCPACGGVHVSTYPIRERRVHGVPDGNTPVEIVFTTHRIYCPDCGSSSVEKVPFLAGAKSRVTKSLANTVMGFRGGMSIRQVAEALHLSWDQVKSIEKSRLARGFAHVSLAKVEALTIDEMYLFPKAASDMKCVTIVRDAKTGDVLHVGDGRGADALKGFERRLRRHRRRIRHVCMDMSGAYARWVRAFLPDADVVYDHFHVVKAMNDRLDKVRRRTMGSLDADLRKVVKGQRFTLTRNAESLSPKESARLREMRGTFSELSDVYAMKEHLRGIYSFAQYEYGARLLLEDWCATARLTKVPELVSMAKTVEDHMEGILGYWRHGKACNSGAEGFNNKVRWLVRQAYGLRDREYFRLKIYALPDTETTRSL